MLAALKSRDSDATVTVQMFMFASQDFNPTLIRATAHRFIRGEVEGHNRAFAPSTAEFVAEMRRAIAPSPGQVARERIEETKQLTSRFENVPPPTEESKARVDALVEGFKQTREKDEEKWARWRKQGEEAQAEIERRMKEHDGQVMADGTGKAAMEALENLRVARLAGLQVEYMDKQRAAADEREIN